MSLLLNRCDGAPTRTERLTANRPVKYCVKKEKRGSGKYIGGFAVRKWSFKLFRVPNHVYDVCFGTPYVRKSSRSVEAQYLGVNCVRKSRMAIHMFASMSRTKTSLIKIRKWGFLRGVRGRTIGFLYDF